MGSAQIASSPQSTYALHPTRRIKETTMDEDAD